MRLEREQLESEACRIRIVCRDADLEAAEDLDDGDDEAYNVEMRNVSTWRMAHELKGARLHFMNNRANEGIAALEKFRRDLLLYARDAAA